MSWLVLGDRVLASVEIAERRRERMVGLIGREGIDGALLLRPARGVHTIGVRFAIDVAYCDAELRVIEIATMKPRRMGLPRRRATQVVEAEAGQFERWGVVPGDELEVRS